MRVVLPVSSTWVSRPKGNLLLYQPRGVPGLVVLLSPLQPYPEDAAEWVRRQFTVEAIPPDAEVSMVVVSDLATVDGWPLHYAEGHIASAAGVEARAVILYRFVDHGAGVIVRSPDAAQLAAHREEVLDVLGQATPDWGTQDTACLANLFAGVVKPKASTE
jgi:hypothetical protein